MDLGFETSLDEALRRCVAGYVERRRLSARQLRGRRESATRSFIGEHERSGGTSHGQPCTPTDKVLSFMGKRPLGPNCSCARYEAFIAVTGMKASSSGAWRDG